jgi:cell division transport system permease protein
MFRFLAFSLRRAARGLRANLVMTAAATATIVLMLTLLSGLLVVLTGLDATLKYVQQEVQVVANVSDSATAGQVTGLQSSLSAMPEVSSVRYVSKAQALADFLARYPDEADVVGSLPDNPLPASLEIELRDPSDYATVASWLKEQPAIAKVMNIRTTVDQLVTVTGVLRTGGVVVLLVVGLIVLFVVVNTIRLAIVSRADEIEVMRLVGASDAFIRWPFIFEGAFMGLLGAVVTIGLLWVAQAPITSFMADWFEILPVDAGATVGRDVALVVLGTGLGIGVVGSWLSVRSSLAR